jgi:hypothetical protein
MAVTHWYDEPDIPEALEDYPRECMFCGKVVEQRNREPYRVDVSSYLSPDVAHLFVTHERCLNDKLHAIYRPL